MKYEPLEKYVKLSQGLVVNKSTEHLFSDKQSDDYIYPLLRVVDFESDKPSYSRFVSKTVPQKVIVDEESILFTRVTCQCFRGLKGVFHNNLFKVELINDELTQDYLFVVLQSDFVKEQALKLTSSSVVPDLTHDMFKSIKIPVPDKSTQKVIADTILNFNNKIANNNAIISANEELIEKIFSYWFLQFNFPDKNGNPYKISGGEMIYNEELQKSIPKDWKVTKLKGLYKIERGISYSSKDIKNDTGVPMINLACIDTNRNYRSGELKYYDGRKADSYILEANDLMIACTDLTRDADIVGSPFLVPDDGQEYIYSMDIAKITSISDELDNMYLYSTLRTDYYHNYIKNWASGTNVLHLDLSGLDWYPIWLPPINIQNAFSELVQKINSKISIARKENEAIIPLRDWLLPMLMNGQIKIAN